MQHNLLLLNTHEFGINPAFGNNRQQGKARVLTHKIATNYPTCRDARSERPAYQYLTRTGVYDITRTLRPSVPTRGCGLTADGRKHGRHGLSPTKAEGSLTKATMRHAERTPDTGKHEPKLINKAMKAKIKEGLLIRSIAGEHVLIDASGNVDLSKMAMLSDTAASIIKAMQRGVCTAEELAKGLTEEYDVSEREALGDVKELLARLAEQGLVVKEDDGEGR